MKTPLETLRTFTLNSLPNLDTVVLGALSFLKEETLPSPRISRCNKPLIVGSGNAYEVGKILFADVAAIFADENTYLHAIDTYTDIDGVVLISASGGKHAIEIAKTADAHDIPVTLYTNTKNARAAEFASNVLLFPHIREPYTYNVSTYLAMLLGHSGEDIAHIESWIQNEVAPRIKDSLRKSDRFFITVPNQFEPAAHMIATKFDELFGAEVTARVFTVDQAKHAKTVVPSSKEHFIHFGSGTPLFGAQERQTHIPLPQHASAAHLIASAYYVVGTIQASHPSYFQNHIVTYTKHASKLFGHPINPIVE